MAGVGVHESSLFVQEVIVIAALLWDSSFALPNQGAPLGDIWEQPLPLPPAQHRSSLEAAPGLF